MVIVDRLNDANDEEFMVLSAVVLGKLLQISLDRDILCNQRFRQNP